MKLFTDKELELLIQDRVNQATLRLVEIHEAQLEQLDGNHKWEIRRLTARAEDAETDRDKFRGSYKNALIKLKKIRKSLAQANRQLMAAGLAQDAEPNDDGSPKLDNVQSIFDASLAGIPSMDDMSQNHVRAYIERQFRARGSKAGGEILDEVLAGDLED